MAKIVEPPVLLSRILTFVLATSVVVLGSLAFTLYKMIPLERPEVFFLFTPTRSTNVVIAPLVPDANNEKAFDAYQRGFLQEYIIARNTLSTAAGVTSDDWLKVVIPWSSKEIASNFTKTKVYERFSVGGRLPDASCSVNFSSPDNDKPITRLSSNANGSVYNVKFTWICKNSGGQTLQKFYTIQIRLQSDLVDDVSETFANIEKLRDNPLGIQVVGYKVLEGDVDPLDSDVASW